MRRCASENAQIRGRPTGEHRGLAVIGGRTLREGPRPGRRKLAAPRATVAGIHRRPRRVVIVDRDRPPARRRDRTVLRYRRRKIGQRRRHHRTMASEPVCRAGIRRLRGLSGPPTPGHREQRVDGADGVRLDHPRAVPGRALHRAVEQRLYPSRRQVRRPARRSSP